MLIFQRKQPGLHRSLLATYFLKECRFSSTELERKPLLNEKVDDHFLKCDGQTKNGKTKDHAYRQSTADYLFQQMNLRDWVVFKDADYIVINKPAQVPVFTTAGRQISIEKCLHQLKYSLPELPKPCHLGDTEESGLLLLARSTPIYYMVVERIKNGTFWDRQFLAIVNGKLLPGRGGVIRLPLRREALVRGLSVPDTCTLRGEMPVTKWRTLAYHSQTKLALLELKPTSHSGCLKHQARAHCAYGLNSPIIGDNKYESLSRRWSVASGLISDTTSTNTSNCSIGKSEAKDYKSFLQRDHLLLHLHQSQAEFDSSSGDRVVVRCGLPHHMTHTFSQVGWKHPQLPVQSGKLVLDDDETTQMGNPRFVKTPPSHSNDALDVEIEQILAHKGRPMAQHPLVLNRRSRDDDDFNFPDLR